MYIKSFEQMSTFIRLFAKNNHIEKPKKPTVNKKYTVVDSIICVTFF